uniref:Uncharacterized protein n=1 Tax=Takifugu rubripes TaxID=31033 RepID=A0A3B5KFR3_TAKRU
MKLFFLIVVSAVTAGLVSFGLWNFRQEGGNQGQKDALRQDESYARAKRTVVSHLGHSWLEQDPESPHIYGLNTWWRYANFTARTQNHSRCYVCSMLPVSVHTPRITAEPMTGSEGQCFVHIGLSRDPNFTIKLLDGTWFTRSNCTQKPLRTMAGKANRFRFPVLGAINHTYCYARSGGRDLGSLHKDVCKVVYTSCALGISDDVKLNYITDRYYRETCLQQHKSSEQCEQECMDDPRHLCGYFTLDESTQMCPEGYNCTCNYPTFTPEDKGTQLVDKGWWLCGHNAYAHLPANWSGVCAPVHLKDHTIIIYANNTENIAQKRLKQDLNEYEFKPHDSVWGTDVPQEFKHWTDGQKVSISLFPWVGVAKNILRLETVDYRLKVFTNLTKVALAGVKEEMTALRLMTMQNRMALDLITAPQGGVCAMVGDYCCTFIPENDADGHLIDSALRNLTKLQRAMIDDGSPPPDWLTKMLSGWRELLFKIGIMIGIVLLVLAILACCVVPLVRGCIGRLVGSVVTSTLLQVEEQSLLDDDEEESEEEWINVIQDVKEMFKMS